MQVDLLNHMGNDLAAVNAARVSFANRRAPPPPQSTYSEWICPGSLYAFARVCRAVFFRVNHLSHKCHVMTTSDTNASGADGLGADSLKPWWTTSPPDDVVINSRHGSFIAEARSPELADEIVRACNAHDGLVEALKRCMGALSVVSPTKGDDPDVVYARAALSQATSTGG